MRDWLAELCKLFSSDAETRQIKRSKSLPRGVRSVAIRFGSSVWSSNRTLQQRGCRSAVINAITFSGMLPEPFLPWDHHADQGAADKKNEASEGVPEFKISSRSTCVLFFEVLRHVGIKGCAALTQRLTCSVICLYASRACQPRSLRLEKRNHSNEDQVYPIEYIYPAFTV